MRSAGAPFHSRSTLTANGPRCVPRAVTSQSSSRLAFNSGVSARSLALVGFGLWRALSTRHFRWRGMRLPAAQLAPVVAVEAVLRTLRELSRRTRIAQSEYLREAVVRLEAVQTHIKTLRDGGIDPVKALRAD